MSNSADSLQIAAAIAAGVRGQRFMTTKEVADLLRTSPETVRYWAWQGKGPKSFKAGKKRLYAAEDVDAYIAERRAAGAA